MSDKEQTGKRDLTYSRWHRIESTERFLSSREAWELGMIDIDDVEYCRRCNQPLALIETTKDAGQREKVVVVTRIIARKLEVPAYVVFVTATPDGQDVKSFRVRKVAPVLGSDVVMTPNEYAQMLARLRVEHKPHCTATQSSILTPKDASPFGAQASLSSTILDHKLTGIIAQSTIGTSEVEHGR